MEDKEINEALKNVLEIVEMEQERRFVSNSELFDHLLSAYSSQLNTQQQVPTQVSPSYAGLHLGKYYENNDFRLLIKSFKNNQLLDAFYALKIIEDAKTQLTQMSNVRECVIDDASEPGCVIVGDLHGNFNDLHHIILKYGIPGETYKFIFNGDYVDRGEKQLEVLLTVLYAFLIRPDRVFLNRGNHEDITLNTSANFRPNFKSSFSRYGKYSSYLFTSAVNMFCYMPLATVLNNLCSDVRFFIVHGGINDDIDLYHLKNGIDRSNFRKLTFTTEELRDKDKRMLSDLLWSDPIQSDHGLLKFNFLKKNTGCHFNSRRNIGCLFGVDVTEKFCKKNGFTAIIRSHEVREKGYSEDHARCLTVFSASFYCGGTNFGAVFKLEPSDRTPAAYSFKNKTVDQSDSIYKNNNLLIKQFKKLIQAKQAPLMYKFEQLDVDKRGAIAINDWAEIVSNEFNNEISIQHLIALKDFLCECETNLNLVYYQTLFKNKSGQTVNSMNRDYLRIVKNLFDILDKNGDKRISVDEARDALMRINQKIGQTYSIKEDCVNFIRNMDRNGDQFVDLDEFKRAFLSGDDLDSSLESQVSEKDEHINSDESEEGELQIVRL